MPRQTHEKTWVLIADGARARIFVQAAPGGTLEPVLKEEDTKSRLHTRELGTDKPGRTHERIADGSRHALAPRVDWHVFEKQLFAKKMAKILDQGAAQKSYDRLVLVAPPKALGELREAIGKAARESVVKEIAKDLTPVPPHELPAHLEDALRFAPNPRPGNPRQ